MRTEAGREGREHLPGSTQMQRCVLITVTQENRGANESLGTCVQEDNTLTYDDDCLGWLSENILRVSCNESTDRKRISTTVFRLDAGSAKAS